MGSSPLISTTWKSRACSSGSVFLFRFKKFLCFTLLALMCKSGVRGFFGVCLIKAALEKVVSNMQVYRQDSIHGIHKALLLMEGITDQTKFLTVKKELSEILGSIVQLLSEAYARMNTLGMLQRLSQEQKDFLFSFLYLKDQMAQSPTLVPIYYEASGGVYETRFPTKFGRPGVYWADFTHVAGQDEHSETASRQYYDTYLKCRDVYDSLVRLEDFIKVFIEREAAPVKEKAPAKKRRF